MCHDLPVPSDDPEDRITELEGELAEARAEAASRRRPESPADGTLAPAPRRVPATFLLAELLPFRWWYIWGLFMVGVALIAVWAALPLAFTVTAVMALVVIYGFQIFGASRRLALLKWGEVATVTGSDVVTRGTYYSGTTWSNAYLPVAHGWSVERPRYSGPSTKTQVSYRLGDHEGQITVRGREYEDGVVLADPRNPAHAMCVSSFAYDLDRDPSGNWVGRLRPRLVVGMVVWAVVVIGWLALAGFVATWALGAQSSSATTPAGGKLSVNGNGKSVELACNASAVTINGNGNHVTLTGHCHRVAVNGAGNHVEIDEVDEIAAAGVGNEITYQSGNPAIDDSGVSSSIHLG